jgi:putative transposase
MARQHHMAEQIMGKLREIEVGLAGRRTVGELCRSVGVGEQTYYLYGRLSRCKTGISGFL